jgi:hypothetical protein
MATREGALRGGSTIASDLIAAVERAAGGEKILWAGRPNEAKTVSYGLRHDGYWFWWFFFAFAVFWIIAASSGMSGQRRVASINYVFPLFGLPFLAIGIWGVTAPWRNAGRARRTVFALTENRLIHVMAASSGLTSQSIFPSNMLSVTSTESPDGTGTIVITLSETETWGQSYGNKQFALVGVEDPTTAARLLDAMRAGRKGAT